MSYLPCELHCHTLHSDGDFEIKELLQKAKENNIELIALTDHNTVSGHCQLDDSITPAIKGIEWTTYFGHMLVLGATKYVDWRSATPSNIDQKILQIKECDAVVGIAHPCQIGSPICTGGRWEFEVKNWHNIDYVEICHEAFGPDNYENSRAFHFWTKLLDKGYHICATYGRDWHREEPTGHYGVTYIDINGKATPEKALNAIKQGKTVVSTGAKLFFTVKKQGKEYTIGDTVLSGVATLKVYFDSYAREKYCNSKITCDKINIVTNNSQCVLQLECLNQNVSIDLKANQWYRAELWGHLQGQETLLAVTSPIYVK